MRLCKYKCDKCAKVYDDIDNLDENHLTCIMCDDIVHTNNTPTGKIGHCPQCGAQIKEDIYGNTWIERPT